MNPIYTKYKKIAFVGICVTTILLILYASYLGLDVYTKEVYHYTLAPFQTFMQRGVVYLRALRQKAHRIQELEAQLHQTQLEILQYQDLLKSFHAQELEDKQHLQELLSHMSSLYKDPFITGRVISKDPQNLFSTLVIDVGHHAGAKQYMPVVTLKENALVLVGYIYAMGPYSATVRTILDHRCHVSVLIEDLRSVGIMKGQVPMSHHTLVDYIDIHLENLEERLIVTSGFTDKYPKNILIGTIIQASKKNYGFFQQVTVKPMVNFFTIEHVFVIPHIPLSEE